MRSKRLSISKAQRGGRGLSHVRNSGNYSYGLRCMLCTLSPYLAESKSHSGGDSHQLSASTALFTMSAESQSLGFPQGYFVIRSVATGRLLDVSGSEVEDGTEVILWPEKEQSLVESECAGVRPFSSVMLLCVCRFQRPERE